MDQFASKVVEKCLKIGGPEFLESYLDRICEGRPGRPRIPLIDSKSLLSSHPFLADNLKSPVISMEIISSNISSLMPIHTIVRSSLVMFGT
jgi:hypothetical protein